MQPLALAPRLFEVGRSSVWGIDSEQWGDTHACNGHQQLSRVAFASARVPSRNKGHLGSRRRPTWEVRMCTASQGFYKLAAASRDSTPRQRRAMPPCPGAPLAATSTNDHRRGMRACAWYAHTRRLCKISGKNEISHEKPSRKPKRILV